MKTKRNKGQSTIEFILSCSIVFGFFFTILKLSLNFASGYYAHYATYMSSRAYLVADQFGQYSMNDAASEPSSVLGNIANGAAEAAEKEFRRYKVDSVLFGNKGGNKFEVIPPSINITNLFVGVKYSFDQKFNLVAAISGSEANNLVSESYLGFETTRTECMRGILNRYKLLGIDVNSSEAASYLVTYEDNGC